MFNEIWLNSFGCVSTFVLRVLFTFGVNDELAFCSDSTVSDTHHTMYDGSWSDACRRSQLYAISNMTNMTTAEPDTTSPAYLPKKGVLLALTDTETIADMVSEVGI